MSRWGVWTALLLSNLLFGLAHLITIAYAFWAGIAGLLLGLLFQPRLLGLSGEESNLLAPIIAHGLYDFLAFVLVARRYRQQNPQTSADSSPVPDTAHHDSLA